MFVYNDWLADWLTAAFFRNYLLMPKYWYLLLQGSKQTGCTEHASSRGFGVIYFCKAIFGDECDCFDVFVYNPEVLVNDVCTWVRNSSSIILVCGRVWNKYNQLYYGRSLIKDSRDPVVILRQSQITTVNSFDQIHNYR